MAAILVGMVVSLARPAQVRDLLDQTKEPFFDLTANTVFTGQMQFLNPVNSEQSKGQYHENFAAH